MSIAAELKEKYPVLFEALTAKIGEDENPEEEINRLNRAYEDGEPNAKQLIREVSDLCLEGFRETMKRVGVTYDSWDWESDFVWSTQVNEVLAKLKASPFVYSEKGVLEFDAEKVVQTLGLKGKVGFKPKQRGSAADAWTRRRHNTLHHPRHRLHTLEVQASPKSHQRHRHGAVAGAVAAKNCALRNGLQRIRRESGAFRLQLGYVAGLQDEQQKRTLHHIRRGFNRSGSTGLRRGFEAFPHAFRRGETQNRRFCWFRRCAVCAC